MKEQHRQHIQQDQKYRGSSHFQYQFNAVKDHTKVVEQNKVECVQIINKTIWQNIIDFIKNGKNIVLSHASYKPIGLDQFQSISKQLGVKQLLILKNQQEIMSYISANKQLNSQCCFIINLFGYTYLQYKPSLMKFLIHLQNYIEKYNCSIKIILYCSKMQEQKLMSIVENVGSKINKQKCINVCENFQIVQYDIVMPFDYSVSQNLLQVLEKFLNDQFKQATKKSVVIFHEPTDQLKKKIIYLTKTRGYHLFTQVLFEQQQEINAQKNENKSTTKIFIFRNIQTLKKKLKDLSEVYLVLDYQENIITYFNYQRTCYIEVRNKISYNEKCKRVNLIMGNMGEYSCCEKYVDGDYMPESQEIKYIDYGNYCMSMVKLGLIEYLNQQTKQIPELKYCLNTLKSLGIISAQNQLTNNQILNLSLQGINAILAKSILDHLSKGQEQLKRVHLLMLTHAILTSPNLQNAEGKQSPTAIWHKTGYLQSCLDIILKCMEYKSKPDLYGIVNFQEIVYNLQIQPLVKDKIINQYERCRKLFKCQTYQWKEQYSQNDFDQLLQVLITIFKPAVGTFSGSRRLGYLFKGLSKGLLASKQCLMSHFHQKPNFIFVTKLSNNLLNENLQIVDCNYIKDDILIYAHGCLPTLSRQSFGQCQIQFHNVSSATFTHLSQFDGLQLQIFEKQNNCSIQANSELNTITIQCSKQKKGEINEKFQKMLKDINDMFKNQTKRINYSKKTDVFLSTGAQLIQVVQKDENKSKQIKQMCVIKNLAPQVGIQQLKELFDQFIQIKDLKIVNQKGHKQAIAYFYSAQDYNKFYQTFSGCNYYDHCMIIQPYVDNTIVIQKQKYLLFQWNMWKSTGQVLIQFENVEQAKASLINFKNLAGEKAKVQQNINIIFAQHLDTNVDQKQISKWVMGQGKIINIEVRRFQPKNPLSEDISIKMVIRGAFREQQIQCNVQKTIRGKNGHRSCKVFIQSKEKMQQIYFVLNEASNLVGLGKLYVTPTYTLPIKLPQPDESYVNVYIDIINDFSKELGRIQPLQIQVIRQPLQYYLIVKSNSQAEMAIIQSHIPQKLKGEILNINVKNSSILFSQFALKNFKKIEKQFPVKIIPNIFQKNIKILCKSSTTKFIEKHINTQIMQSFVYEITLYNKAFIHLQKNIGSILQEQLKTNLKVRFENLNKKLYLEGNLFVLEKVRQKINKYLSDSKQKAEQNLDFQNVCALCCQQFNHPFKLQGCGHKFCFQCLQNAIKVTTKDINLYPIKCPQCSDKLWISDIQCFIQPKQWSQIQKIAVNQFIYKRPGQYMFCLTTGCTAIIHVQFKSSFNCYQCKKGYCLNCNNLIHPGMTCHQARYGSDRLFTQYMSTIGGRVCANKQCKAPIQRISGCFKVQCSRCKKCMCFKCPPLSMIAYDTPQQTYNHLNKLHGGCF